MMDQNFLVEMEMKRTLTIAFVASSLLAGAAHALVTLNSVRVGA